ncbi:MAG: hypothetical protein ABFD60_03210 [Bryobacteraceae bacterium]
MDEIRNEGPVTPEGSGIEVRSLIRDAIEEFARKEAERAEPAYKAELLDERQRREALERRVNELISENTRSRQLAEETDKNATIRSELQRLGVVKVDLAFRAVKDDVRRAEDGGLVVACEDGSQRLREYLTQFVNDNPEFLPARNLGGSGVTASRTNGATGPVFDLDKIKPGMSAEELEKARREVARIAAQSLNGI